MENLQNKNILVYGLGRSGEAVISYLKKTGANIFLFDKNDQALNKFVNSTYVIPLQESELFSRDYKFWIISPGVSKFNKNIIKATQNKIKIISELEFAYRCVNANLFAITGTNGKTTTTSMLYAIFQEYTINSFALGNIGVPLIEKADELNEKSLVSLEVSSFQLEFVEQFRPKISCILNFAPDHLNRYCDFWDYIKTKALIFRQQRKGDYAILNYDDYLVRGLYKEINCDVYYFSTLNKVKGTYLIENNIYFYNGEKEEFIMSVKDLRVKGIHNVANALAAILMAKLYGIPTSIIASALANFNGLEHRFEYVGNICSRICINDSKATNIASTLTAMQSLPQNSHILLGGSDKGEDFKDLFSKVNKTFNYYIYGAMANKIIKGAKECGLTNNLTLCKNMNEAIDAAFSNSNIGDYIVLSPACASFDEFKNYEERGDKFKEYVRSKNDKN